jgi:hypothetical protein
MKTWTEQAIKQLKNWTKAYWIDLLDADERWERAKDKRGAPIAFVNKLDKSKTVTIHYHPKDTFHSPKLIKEQLETICWTEDSLRKSKKLK